MPHLDITTLGAFRTSLNGHRPACFRTDKVRGLFIYLVVEAHTAHRREKLASIFWPEQPEAQARKNLRQALYCLKKSIDDHGSGTRHLWSAHSEIQFNPNSDYRLDVAQFSAHLQAFQTHRGGSRCTCDGCIGELIEAVALYAGDFLGGFSLQGCPQFEWWLLFKQEHYHHLALEAFSFLGGYFESLGDYQRVNDFAMREIELEPWRENAHRRRMRALVLSGQRAEALRQYQTCRSILWQEMQIEPSRQTQELFERIRAEDTSIVDLARLGKFHEHFERELFVVTI